MASPLVGTPLLDGPTWEVSAAASVIILFEVGEAFFCSDRHSFRTNVVWERRR